MKDRLQTLAPPLEMCQQIPPGYFQDSALVWEEDSCVFGLLPPHVVPRVENTYHEILAPAPLLEEILEQFDVLILAGAVEGDPDHHMDKDRQFGSTVGDLRTHRLTNIFAAPRFHYPVPLTAEKALKIWFEMLKEGSANDQ